MVNQLEEIAAIHSATVVQNAAEASHIIVPDISLKHKMRDDIEYIRMLQIRDNYVLVHYWFYPDSYDVWVNSEEIESPPDFYNQQRPPHSGAWTVIAKWLFDLHKFNEYMNERDYEISSLLHEKQYLKPKLISPVANQFSGTKRPFVPCIYFLIFPFFWISYSPFVPFNLSRSKWATLEADSNT